MLSEPVRRPASPWWVVLPFASGHFISYFYRNMNAVLADVFTRELGLPVSRLGLLTSAYFLAFATLQIPLGIWLDRYGPRKVQLFLLVLSIIGAIVAANSYDLWGLVIARTLIGFGSAACLMATFKAITLTLPHEQWPFYNGIALMVGSLGALASTAPLLWLESYLGWRGCFGLLALLTSLLWLVLWQAVTELRPTQSSGAREMLADLRALYSLPRFWQISLMSLLPQGFYMAFQGLWLGPWLRDVAHWSAPTVAFALLASGAAMVLGSFLSGSLATWLLRQGVRTLSLQVVMIAVCWLCIAGLLIGQGKWAWGLAIGLCFSGAFASLSYSVLSQQVPANLSGRVTTSYNFLLFVVAFALQWGFGLVLEAAGGDYRIPLAGVLLLQIPSLGIGGWLWWQDRSLAPVVH